MQKLTLTAAAEAIGNDNVEKVQEEATKQVTDEFCPNSDYDLETKSYKFECWDPDNKWDVHDVYNHMGEALEYMFRGFNVESKAKQYSLDVLEKFTESFPMQIEIMKSKNVNKVIDNFRNGHVKEGGFVKFYPKSF